MSPATRRVLRRGLMALLVPVAFAAVPRFVPAIVAQPTVQPSAPGALVRTSGPGATLLGPGAPLIGGAGAGKTGAALVAARAGATEAMGAAADETAAADWEVASTPYYGVSTAGLDFNGDGFGDLAVGHPLITGSPGSDGRVYLYLGSATGLATTAAWSIQGSQVNAEFGQSVSSAGDVNGDGREDLLVGAPGWTGTRSREGAVFLFLGRADGAAPTVAWSVFGGQASARLGDRVAGVGDVNGDGRADVVVASPSYSHDAIEDGLVSLFLGTGSGLSNSAAWTVWGGPQNGLQLGRAVTGRDLTGDGLADITVGGPGYNNGPIASAGLVAIFPGHRTLVSTTPLAQLAGDQLRANLGYALASVFNFDGQQGWALALGVPGYSRTFDREGLVTVFTLPGGQLTLEASLLGGAAGMELGYGLADAQGFVLSDRGAYAAAALARTAFGTPGRVVVVSGDAPTRTVAAWNGTGNAGLGLSLAAVYRARTENGQSRTLLAMGTGNGLLQGYYGRVASPAPQLGTASFRFLHNVAFAPVPVGLTLQVDADGDGAYDTPPVIQQDVPYTNATVCNDPAKCLGQTTFVPNVPVGLPAQLTITAFGQNVRVALPQDRFAPGKSYTIQAAEDKSVTPKPDKYCTTVPVINRIACLGVVEVPNRPGKTGAADVTLGLWNGVPDAGPVGFRLEGATAYLAQNLAPGDAGVYVSLPEGVHRIELRQQPAGTLLRVLTVDLTGRGGQVADLLAKGYLRPQDNPNPFGAPTPAFGGVSVNASGQGTATAAPSERGAPGAFVLRGAWPNPASGAATVLFDLAEASAVRLEVYDALGRRVLAVAEAPFAAGEGHRLGLGVAGLPSGLYVVRVVARAGGREAAQTGRLTVAR